MTHARRDAWWWTTLFAALASLFAVALGGCGGGDFASTPTGGVGAPGPGGTIGATPGGAQDIGFVRGQIERGQVPQPDHVTVEGMLAEHDLPLDGERCDEALCLRTALALAPGADDDATSAWVQLGFGSGISSETFRRPDLNLALVVDRSGSMGGESIAAARDALHRLVAQLTPRDRLAIVLFDDRVDVLVAPAFVTDRGALDAAIDTITVRGSTDIEAGLARGYELVAGFEAPAGMASRVLLFTDAQPNQGRTDAASFVGLARRYAERRIGLTAFGVGVDFGMQLVHELGQVRGAAYYYLQDAARVRQVFDRDFDYLVTPLAYDLEVRFQAAPGWRVAQVYGIREWSARDDVAVIRVPTVFASRSRGGIVLRLAPARVGEAPARQVAQTTLHYERALSAAGAPAEGAVNALVTTAYADDAALVGGARWFQQAGVRKAVALTNWVLGVRAGLALFARGDRPGAVARLVATRDGFAAEAVALNDPALDRERVLLDRLLQTVRP